MRALLHMLVRCDHLPDILKPVQKNANKANDFGKPKNNNKPKHFAAATPIAIAGGKSRTRVGQQQQQMSLAGGDISPEHSFSVALAGGKATACQRQQRRLDLEPPPHLAVDAMRREEMWVTPFSSVVGTPWPSNTRKQHITPASGILEHSRALENNMPRSTSQESATVAGDEGNSLMYGGGRGGRFGDAGATAAMWWRWRGLGSIFAKFRRFGCTRGAQALGREDAGNTQNDDSLGLLAENLTAYNNNTNKLGAGHSSTMNGGFGHMRCLAAEGTGQHRLDLPARGR